MKIPKPLIFINSIILLVFLLPVIYMFWRFAAFYSNLSSFLESWDVLSLFLNTLYLFIAVVTTSVLLGVMLSILVVRVNLPFPKIIFTLTILPLVIPSYIGALTYVSAFSPKGLFVDIISKFGINEIPGLEGFLGSWIVLTLFTYPYVQLICTSALRNLDSTIEDAAKSLGAGSFRIYSSVVIPRLKTHNLFFSLVGLYVISDFCSFFDEIQYDY